jgi:hypothetical protein
MSKLVTIAVLLSTTLGMPMQANAAWWTICNQTAEEMQVAIAYLHTSNQWLSEGWWTVHACGGCARVMDLSKTDRVNQFFRAVTPNGSERVGGSSRFCVSSHAKGAPPWTGRSGPRCGGDYISAGFKLQAIEYSDRDFKTNITGAVAGRRCID